MALRSSLRSWHLRIRAALSRKTFSIVNRRSAITVLEKRAGGVMTVRFTYRENVIRILGAGYWRRGKAIYERENKIHK